MARFRMACPKCGSDRIVKDSKGFFLRCEDCKTVAPAVRREKSDPITNLNIYRTARLWKNSYR